MSEPAETGAEWQQECVDGVWFSTHVNTKERLRFDSEKQDWVPCSDCTQATNENDCAAEKPVNQAQEASTAATTDAERQKHTRNVDNIWIYRDPSSGQACYYNSTSAQWVPLTSVPTAAAKQKTDKDKPEEQKEKESSNPPAKEAAAETEDDDFEYQIEQEQQGSAQSTASSSSGGCNRFVHPVSGAEYEWSSESNDWVPLVDDDFIARYMMSYGVQHDEEVVKASVSSLPKMAEFETNEGGSSGDEAKEEETEKQRAAREEQEKLAAMTPQEKKDYMKEKKKRLKAEAAEREKNKGWFQQDMSDNRNVYVSNLPTSITDKEFEDLMCKCGVIDLDPHTRKTKVKLYKTDTGENKGDGRCCYVKHESVELALQILDGADVGGKRISVQVATFEMKGQEFDRTKRKKKLTAKQLKRFKEQQERLFDWRPEKLRGERAKHERTVVVKNLFTVQELDLNAALLMEVEETLKAEAEKHGKLKKMTVFDNNPDGVATLTYDTAEEADDAVTMMDYRVLRNRQIRAEKWDGRTKYKMAESKEDAALRAQAWADFLEGSSSDEEEGEKDKGNDGEKHNDVVVGEKRKIGEKQDDAVPEKQSRTEAPGNDDDDDD